MSAPPWTRAPTGTSVGTCHFSSRRRTTNLHGSRQQGAAIRLSPTRGYYGAVDYKGLLVIIEHNPPTHLVATMPRRTSYTTHYGLEDEGADMLRHIIAAAGGPRRSPSFGSAVLITYPPTCAPLPLHYSCDSGTSCCDAQRGLWHTDIGRACCGTQLRQRTSAIRGPHLLPAHPLMITTSFYTTVEHSRTFVQQGRGGGSHTIDTGSAFNRQFFSVLSVQWRHQRHHGYQSRWCYGFSAAVLVGINRSTNSVGLPTTTSSDLSNIFTEPSDE